MIEREELEELRKRRPYRLFSLEKEYLLMIFLYALSEISDKFVFKGGTCLRLAYSHERLSEDIDLNTDLSMQKVDAIFEKIMEKYKLLGIEYNLMKKEIFENSFTVRIRFKGPLYANREDSTNSIRIDVSQRKNKEKKIMPINKLFSDIPFFFITCMAEEEIFAEKIRSLFQRNKGRDLYDVWVLLKKGLKVEGKMLKEKFLEENIRFDINNLNLCSKMQYDNDMRDLVPAKPDYSILKKEVMDFLNQLPHFGTSL